MTTVTVPPRTRDNGAAVGRRPDPGPFWLEPGDPVEVEIEKVGVLQNAVVSAPHDAWGDRAVEVSRRRSRPPGPLRRKEAWPPPEG